MSERLIQVWELARQAVENPAANPGVAAFVLSAVIIVVLMLVLSVLLLLTPKKRSVVKVVRRVRRPATEGEPAIDAKGAVVSAEPAIVEGWVDEADRPLLQAGKPSVAAEQHKARRPQTAASRILGAALAPILVLFGLVAGYVVTGTDAYCTQFCHAASETVMHAVELDHASCVGCHEVPGAAGLVANSASRVRMLVSYASGERQSDGAVVDSSACIRCHSKVLDETIQSDRAILMSHAEPHDAGVTCLSCHQTTGHDPRRDYTMASCITCHDEETASAACETCHAADPYAVRGEGSDESTQTVGSGDVLYPVTFVGDRPCGGCHDEEITCDPCHGLRMPHDTEFIEWRHARYAAFEKKEMCRKCHTEQWCSSGCHIGFPGHLEGWKQEHKSAPRDAGCGCHASRTGRTEPMCVLCHDW